MCSTPCCRTLRAGDCVSRVFRRLIQRGCGGLGRTAARLPCLFLSLGLLVLFAGVPGLFLLEGDVDLLFIKVDSDFISNFAFPDSRYMTDYARGIAAFPEDRGSLITLRPIRPLGSSPFVPGPLSLSFMRDVIEIERQITSTLNVTVGGATYGYGDLCVREFAGGGCLVSSLSSVVQRSPLMLDALAASGNADITAAMDAADSATGGSLRGQFALLVGSSNSSWMADRLLAGGTRGAGGAVGSVGSSYAEWAAQAEVIR